MSVGAIEFQILADLKRLKSDMDAAKGMVGGAADGMSKAFSGVKTALGALGLGLSLAGISSWVKGAIDAADETGKMAQKMGVATKDVAGLQLAFKMAGVESGAMVSATTKLSKAIDGGNDSLKAMGVETRNADGSLRSTKSVLADVADQFQGMDNGARKTALAVDIFGKAGADLIPLLNDGSEGLLEMEEMAEKLGMTISQETADAADQFGDTLDLVKSAGEGMATQIAAKMLPTLNKLAGGFLQSMTEGDRLNKIAASLSAGLKMLYSAGAIVVQVFATVGKTLGAAGAAVVAVMSGDFKGAIDIGRMAAQDLNKDWKSTATDISRVWSDTTDDTVTNMAAVVKATGGSTQAVRESGEAQKAAAAAAKQRAKDEADAAKEIAKAIAEEEKARQAAADAQAKRDLADIARYEAKQAAVDASIASAAQMVEAIRLETQQLGMSNEEREISIALLQLEKTGIEKGTYAYETYAEEIRAAIVDRNAVKQSIEQVKAIDTEWDKLTADIGQGLTDSLFRAFESGKNFFQTFWDGVKNVFKTTVLQMLISPVQKGISGVLGGVFSSAASASGLGGVDLGSIGSSIGSAIGIDSIAGGLGTLGAGLATVAPYLAAVGALAAAFQYKPTHHVGSVVNIGGGAEIGGDGSGIMKNFNADTDAALKAIGGLSTDTLNSLSTAFGGTGGYGTTLKFAADGKDASIGSFGLSQNGQLVSGGFGLDNRDFNKYSSDAASAFGAFAGDVAINTRKALDMLDLPAWAKDQFAKLRADAGIEDIAAVAAEVIALQAASKETKAADVVAQQEMTTATSGGFATLDTSVQTIGENIVASIEAMKTDIKAGLSAIAAAANATTRQLNAWDDGDAMLTRAAT